MMGLKRMLAMVTENVLAVLSADFKQGLRFCASRVPLTINEAAISFAIDTTILDFLSGNTT